MKACCCGKPASKPLLVIFEDLHWIDGETQALLDGLVESLGSARLLLLVNYRPEYQHAWGSKTYYTQLRLDALPAESAEELLDALLGDDPGLAPLKQLLVRRGNPFFLEETVRTLVETKALEGERGRYRLAQPVQAIQVPPTVQVMLAARIDRLPPEDKRLLQICSVVGKDVPLALLQAIAELPGEALRRGLDHLRAAEFVYETGLFPDLEYSFTHALTHEVTYGGLLQERRRDLHARIVAAIETLHRDRLGGADRAARPSRRAGRAAGEGGALPPAGRRKAAARSALEDARAWLEQALGVLEALPERPSTLEQAFEIRLELRPVLNQLSEVRPTLERLREAEALAEKLNDDRRRGRVCAFMTVAHSLLGELDEAIGTGARALATAERLGDVRLRILTTTSLEQAHYFRGDYEQVVELATDNLAALPADWVYENLGGTAPASVNDRRWLVMSLAQLGRFGEAAGHEVEAIRLAEPTRHAFTVGVAYYAAGTLRLLKGDWAKARSVVELWIAVARTGSVVLHLPPAVASSAWVLAQLGEAGEALTPASGRRAAPRRPGREGTRRQQRLGLPLARSRRSAARPARRGAEPGRPRRPILRATAGVRRPCAAPARRRRDPSRPVRCRARRGPLPSGAGPRRAARHASNRRPLPPWPGQALPAHRQARGGPRAPHIATAMYRQMEMGFWLEQAEAESRPLGA